MALPRLPQHIVRQFRERATCLLAGPPEEFYALGFFIEMHGAPRLLITANTETQVRASLATASDENEARWNYAFWQSAATTEPSLDPFAGDAGAALLARWLDRFGDHADEDTVFRAFGELALQAAQTLQADGSVARVFGRVLPIIFHDLEGRDEAFDWTLRANPPASLVEFREAFAAGAPAIDAPAAAPSDALESLADHIQTALRESLEPLALNAGRDVYAIGIIPDTETRLPKLAVTVNTESRFQEQCLRGRKPHAARWDFAFWRQEPCFDLLEGETGCAVAERLIHSTGHNEAAAFRELCQAIAEAARRLHADGTIARIFGRPIPVLIHDRARRREAVESTRAANPSGRADEFLHGQLGGNRRK